MAQRKFGILINRGASPTKLDIMRIKRGTYLQNSERYTNRVLVVKDFRYCSILQAKTVNGICIKNGKVNEDWEMVRTKFVQGLKSGEIAKIG